MKIVGCDPHARQQTIARVDTETGELIEALLFARLVVRTISTYRKSGRLFILRVMARFANEGITFENAAIPEFGYSSSRVCE
jgi:hypothetical protein